VTELVAHPLASRFPPLPFQEFEALKENISLLGLLHPIVINERGEILDGIHRWKACTQLGIEPATIQLASLLGTNGERISETKFIFAANVHRRHLTNDQRAAIYTAFLPEIQADSNARLFEGCKKGGLATARLRLPGDHTEEESNSPDATLTTGEPFTIERFEPRWKEHERNLTRTRFKEVAGVGARKAARAIKLFNADPRLLEPVISGEQTLLEASRKFEETTRRLETSSSHTTAGKTGCEAKVKKRLLSSIELWAHLEHWNNFHVCRLLKGFTRSTIATLCFKSRNFVSIWRTKFNPSSA
jgi:hypothetical protein